MGTVEIRTCEAVRSGKLLVEFVVYNEETRVPWKCGEVRYLQPLRTITNYGRVLVE